MECDRQISPTWYVCTVGYPNGEMPSPGSAQEEQTTSPLSSDAETEPLPFDETDAMSTRERTNKVAAPPAEEQAMSIAIPMRTEFSGESELTEDMDSDRDQGARRSDDGSSLSEENMEADPIHEPALERSALDGLAELASSSAEAPALEEPNSAASPPLPAETAPRVDEGEAEASAPEEPDAIDEDGDTTVQATNTTPRKGSNGTLRRAVVAAAGKRRAAATGGAPSLLVEPDDNSAPPSAASSRAASPEPEPKEEETPVPEREGEGEGEEDGDAADPEASETRDETTGSNTATDDAEATQHRQEALDLLTRIEIGFSMLRERLYQERLKELEREAEMIHSGSHPELQVLHTLIDARKDRRLALLDVWLRKEEAEYQHFTQFEDETSWINWRDGAAALRRDLLADTDRKRRRLDREKRLLDTPQPARRYQPFEAELMLKPPSYSRDTASRPHQYARPARDNMQSFIAYPDVRGLDEYDVWFDMDQMGIRPMPSMYLPPDMPPPPDAYGPSFPPPPGFERGHPYNGPPPMYIDEYAMDVPRPPEFDARYDKAYSVSYGVADPAPPLTHVMH